jgi:hypothetical protein
MVLMLRSLPTDRQVREKHIQWEQAIQLAYLSSTLVSSLECSSLFLMSLITGRLNQNTLNLKSRFLSLSFTMKSSMIFSIPQVCRETE